MRPVVVRSLIALGALLVLGAVNLSIQEKEHIKAHGQTVYLALAPVDPRSLMQGDYMALRFAIVNDVDTARLTDHLIPLTLDDQRIAHVTRAGDMAGIHMRYRLRNGQVWLGTNAFFFEEGSAARYTAARYGEFRIDQKSAEAVLVALRDEHFQKL